MIYIVPEILEMNDIVVLRTFYSRDTTIIPFRGFFFQQKYPLNLVSISLSYLFILVNFTLTKMASNISQRRFS